MTVIRFALAALFALALAAPASAKGDDPLFAAPDPIQITIKAPLSYLTHNRNAQTPIGGVLVDPAGQSLPINLQLRGITRRTADICDFPPLRVDFTMPPPATSVFAGQKKLKLVTHCRNSASFQQYVLLEYAAYRLYNVLTPRSFRVRLATITYQGDDGRTITQRAGFFIEDLKDVAKRNGTTETHAPPRIDISELSPADAARYAMFQHMIANHDWSMRAGPAGDECCHNAKLIGRRGSGTVITIPYDFDYSGFVNAPYATPPDALKINDVKQRFYRGYCAHNSYALAAAQQIRAAEPQLFATLAQIPGLDPKTQQRAANYLGGFFADIATDATTGGKILNRCVSG
jgi:hypothetical protein